MNIYIDESGSINNHSSNNKNFIIALVYVTDKKALDRAYKRFISSNYQKLKELDKPKVNSKGEIIKPGNRMFINDKFQELKGAQFDKEMKLKFIEFFCKKKHFEIFYIKLDNTRLTDTFCSNTARTFNFTLKLALEYFMKNGYLPKEECNLQLDERNEKTETKYFLENYLNTELTLSGVCNEDFHVTYFDSSNNKYIQIADVLANLYYSELKTGQYTDLFIKLKESDLLKFIFDFPL
ncbi:MAG: DUF3800 domain-containing protein [Lachnospiraceae bacterium]|nr:DUF3800 domain-containing protein [Lachnospiraceae bacterium]